MEINDRDYSSSADSYGTIDVNAGGHTWNTTVIGSLQNIESGGTTVFQQGIQWFQTAGNVFI